MFWSATYFFGIAAICFVGVVATVIGGQYLMALALLLGVAWLVFTGLRRARRGNI